VQRRDDRIAFRLIVVDRYCSADLCVQVPRDRPRRFLKLG
jgi:hypothetical protein